VFGYGPNSRPSTTIVDNRIALGFADIDHHRQRAGHIHQQEHARRLSSAGRLYVGTGYQYTGGNLTIATPLVTGAAGS
jgi:hypothetical protein